MIPTRNRQTAYSVMKLLLTVLLTLLTAQLTRGQFLSQTVREWDDAVGSPIHIGDCADHRNGIVRAVYRTGDIFCVVKFRDGVAEDVTMDFSLFMHDGLVAAIQRQVLNQTFELM